MSNEQDVFVQSYIGQVNSELSQKVLENCNLKAQVVVAQEKLSLLTKELEEVRLKLGELTNDSNPVDPSPKEI